MNERYTIKDGILTVKSGIKEIQDNEFKGNSEFHTVKLPDSLISIGCSAFEECMNLKKIKFNFNLQQIGERAFKDCVSLHCVEIPTNIQKIEPSTFMGCESLRNVEFNKNVKEISQQAFADCKSIKKIKIIGTVLVRPWLFHNCKNMEEFYVDDDKNGAQIDDFAFVGCEKISFKCLKDSNIYHYAIKYKIPVQFI